MIYNILQKDTKINDIKQELKSLKPIFKSIPFNNMSITQGEEVMLYTMALEPGFYHFSTYLSGSSKIRFRVFNKNANNTSIIISEIIGSIFFTMYVSVKTTYEFSVYAYDDININANNISYVKIEI